jgi:hypothetical protein
LLIHGDQFGSLSSFYSFQKKVYGWKIGGIERKDRDGVLVDELMDATAYLSENGPIWVLTPKVGRDGHVEPSDIQDAAPTCGLSQTSTIAVAADWTATRLVARKAGKR